MGLSLDQALLLRDWIQRHGMRGPLLSLGVQHMRFTAAQYGEAGGGAVTSADGTASITDREFYASCGVLDVTSLDANDYEDCDVVFDLNRAAADVPEALISRFGIILNGGTLEHVFHIPHALSSITRMLRPGGVVIHIVPTHNAVDHGFYQINPTLLFDYYQAAAYDILEAASVSWDASQPGPASSAIIPVRTGTFGDGLLGALGPETMLVIVAARKTAQSREAVVPVQRLYAERPRSSPPAPRWFPPYRTERGRPIPAPPPHIVRLDRFEPAGGLAWAAALPQNWGASGDSVDDPIRSQLALFEDGVLLGPPHASHDAIRAEGRGHYSHWGGGLWLSTSDGSDPNTNGRRYEAWLPVWP